MYAEGGGGGGGGGRYPEGPRAFYLDPRDGPSFNIPPRRSSHPADFYRGSDRGRVSPPPPGLPLRHDELAPPYPPHHRMARDRTPPPSSRAPVSLDPHDLSRYQAAAPPMRPPGFDRDRGRDWERDVGYGDRGMGYGDRGAYGGPGPAALSPRSLGYDRDRERDRERDRDHDRHSLPPPPYPDRSLHPEPGPPPARPGYAGRDSRDSRDGAGYDPLRDGHGRRDQGYDRHPDSRDRGYVAPGDGRDSLDQGYGRNVDSRDRPGYDLRRDGRDSLDPAHSRHPDSRDKPGYDLRRDGRIQGDDRHPDSRDRLDYDSRRDGRDIRAQGADRLPDGRDRGYDLPRDGRDRLGGPLPPPPLLRPEAGRPDHRPGPAADHYRAADDRPAFVDARAAGRSGPDRADRGGVREAPGYRDYGRAGPSDLYPAGRDSRDSTHPSRTGFTSAPLEPQRRPYDHAPPPAPQPSSHPLTTSAYNNNRPAAASYEARPEAGSRADPYSRAPHSANTRGSGDRGGTQLGGPPRGDTRPPEVGVYAGTGYGAYRAREGPEDRRDDPGALKRARTDAYGKSVAIPTPVADPSSRRPPSPPRRAAAAPSIQVVRDRSRERDNGGRGQGGSVVVPAIIDRGRGRDDGYAQTGYGGAPPHGSGGGFGGGREASGSHAVSGRVGGVDDGRGGGYGSMGGGGRGVVDAGRAGAGSSQALYGGAAGGSRHDDMRRREGGGVGSGSGGMGGGRMDSGRGDALSGGWQGGGGVRGGSSSGNAGGHGLGGSGVPRGGGSESAGWEVKASYGLDATPKAAQPPSYTAPTAAAPAPAPVQPAVNETEACWHYLDPQGNQQGPCSVKQFRMWVASMSQDPGLAVQLEQFRQVDVWSDAQPRPQPLHRLLARR